MSFNSNYIFEAISACSYPINTKDYVGSVIYELYNMNKSTKYFKVVKDGDKILVAQYKMQINFKGKNYDVPILIYLPKSFPKIPPELYVETKSDVAINPQNKDIDPTTKKISLSSLRAWNNYSTIKGVILDCESSFNRTFPIFKVTNNNYNQNPSNKNTDFTYMKGLEECFMDSNKHQNNYFNTQNQNNNFNEIFSSNTNTNNNKIGYPGEGNNDNFVNFTQQPPMYYNPGLLNINNNVDMTNPYNFNQGGKKQNPSPMKNNHYPGYINNNNLNNNNNFNQHQNQNHFKINYQAEIKKKLVEELKKSIEMKLKDEVQGLQNTKNNLSNYKTGMLNLKEKYSSVLNNKSQAEENIMNKIAQINDEIAKIKQSISNSRDNVMTKENYEKFINIKGDDLIKICAVESTLEDTLMTIKKNFDKGNSNIDESIRLYRQVSKEIMKIKMIKMKLERKYTR